MTPDLEDIFVEDLRELHGTEQAQVRLMETFIEAASSPELVTALERHVETTRRQVERLGKIFSMVGEKPAGEPPASVLAMISDAENKIGRDADNEVIDLAIIAAGRKMEHLEMAAYSTTRSMARVMGLSEAERLIGETLNEEQQSDRKLAQIAEPLLKIAEEMEETEVEADVEEDEAVLLSDVPDESEEEEDEAA